MASHLTFRSRQEKHALDARFGVHDPALQGLNLTLGIMEFGKRSNALYRPGVIFVLSLYLPVLLALAIYPIPPVLLVDLLTFLECISRIAPSILNKAREEPRR